MEAHQEPRYFGLPRRYEDTKPALNQVFAHSNILRVGERILEKVEENAENRMRVAVIDNEARVWAKAEKYKDDCVGAALQEAAKEEVARIKGLDAQHARSITDEVQRIQEFMHQKCVEERCEERKNGERKLQDMIDQMSKHHKLDKLAEVQAARIEEQGIAQSASIEMMRRHEEAMGILTVEMREARKSELAGLKLKLEDYRKESVQMARKEEQKKADKAIIDAGVAHQEDIQRLAVRINQLINENSHLESSLKSVTTERDTYLGKYKKLKKEFTSFIEGCRPDFSPGQADFLVPPN